MYLITYIFNWSYGLWCWWRRFLDYYCAQLQHGSEGRWTIDVSNFYQLHARHV